MPKLEIEMQVLSEACISALHSAVSVANNPDEATKNRLWAVDLILSYSANMPAIDEDEEDSYPSTEEAKA
jgi:hypothetical protein